MQQRSRRIPGLFAIRRIGVLVPVRVLPHACGARVRYPNRHPLPAFTVTADPARAIYIQTMRWRTWREAYSVRARPIPVPRDAPSPEGVLSHLCIAVPVPEAQAAKARNAAIVRIRARYLFCVPLFARRAIASRVRGVCCSAVLKPAHLFQAPNGSIQHGTSSVLFKRPGDITVCSRP